MGDGAKRKGVGREALPSVTLAAPEPNSHHLLYCHTSVVCLCVCLYVIHVRPKRHRRSKFYRYKKKKKKSKNIHFFNYFSSLTPKLVFFRANESILPSAFEYRNKDSAKRKIVKREAPLFFIPVRFARASALFSFFFFFSKKFIFSITFRV